MLRFFLRKPPSASTCEKMLLLGSLAAQTTVEGLYILSERRTSSFEQHHQPTFFNASHSTASINPFFEPKIEILNNFPS